MRRSNWTMVAVVLGSGMVFLDSTVVNVALPNIGEELRSDLVGTLEGQSYVYNAYLLSLSALLILAGALNDFYGRRRMFTLGMVAFGATSLLCGIAPTLELLIVFRVLQGAAGALLVPGSLSIIRASFDGEEQGRAFGIWAGATASTTILGPFVGGVLVDAISWRAAFLINIPLVVLGCYAMRHVEESRDETAANEFDWFGALVVAVAVGGLAFGAIRGEQVQWQGLLPFVSLALGAVAAVAFPLLMARSSHPLVPLELFSSRNFTVTNISTLLIYGALYVTFYVLVIYLQGTIGYNAAAAGIATIPGSLLLAVFSSRFGRLAARYGPRVFMAIGPVVMASGILWLTRFPTSSSPWVFGLRSPAALLPPSSYLLDLLPGLVVFGLGLTIMVAPLTTALMTSVPARHAGVASAVNNAISRVGPQLAGALIFIAIATSFYSGIESRFPGSEISSKQLRELVAPLNRPDSTAPGPVTKAAREASGDAFHLAMALSAGLLVVGAAVNWLGIRDEPIPTDPERSVEPAPEAREAAT